MAKKPPANTPDESKAVSSKEDVVPASSGSQTIESPAPQINAAGASEKPISRPQETPENRIFEALFDNKDGGDWAKVEKIIKDNLPLVLKAKLATREIPESYSTILLFDQVNSIGEDHADRIYNAVSSFSSKRDILLMIGSKGGEIEPAYLISKNCRFSAKDKFVVSVPRRAKSAATLIALGASEIHMGPMSELGPIDPQLGQLPALAMNNALDTIASLVSVHPKSSDMFAKYLESQLDLRILGYFKRINESAKQYATRLLDGKALGEGFDPETLAQHLVDHYNDHSFVIDNEEALRLFGKDIVRCNTIEYLAARDIDKFTRFLTNISRWFYKKEITLVGSIDDCLKVKDCKSE